MDIKSIIEVNRFACDNIASLETAVNSVKIVNDKDKANFGNLCVALRGFRMVADATEAILVNDNVLKGEDGNFYQKIEDGNFYQKVEDTIVPPSTKGAGSDFDIDKGDKK